ncbi:MAG: AAA family ATPase [Pseudomonadota bacterium]
MAPSQPVLWVIAGANGVGKTRYARAHIEAVTGGKRFVNLDEIARGLAPFDPASEQRRAARVTLAMLDDFITGKARNGTSIITLETTLSGRTYLNLFDRAKEAGIKIHLLYFAVARAETSIARVARRVLEGGHFVEETDIRRRFERSLTNFAPYSAKADLWRVFDNNGLHPAVVAEGSGAECRYLAANLNGLPPALKDWLKNLHG